MPLQADAVPPRTHSLVNRARAGFQPPPPPSHLGGCPYAVNNLHGPRVNFCVLMGGESGLDSLERAKNGGTAPSLADTSISDGVCLRAKLPPTAAGVHLPSVGCAHHSALEDEPFLPGTPGAVLPQRSDFRLPEGASLGQRKPSCVSSHKESSETATLEKCNSTAPPGPP